MRQRRRGLGAQAVEQEPEVAAPVARARPRRSSRSRARPVQNTSGTSSAVKSARSAPCSCARSTSCRISGRSRARIASARARPCSLVATRSFSPRSAPCSASARSRKPEKPTQASGSASASSATRDELAERVLEHRVDQVLLGRKAPVQRAHPDAGAARDLLDRRLDAPGREDDARGGDDPVAVRLRVAAQGPRLDGPARHLGSIARKRSGRSASARGGSTSTILPRLPGGSSSTRSGPASPSGWKTSACDRSPVFSVISSASVCR